MLFAFFVAYFVGNITSKYAFLNNFCVNYVIAAKFEEIF